MILKKSMTAFLTVLAFAGLCSGVGRGEDIFSSRWAAAPPQIDGLNAEWTDDALAVQKNVRVEYAFRNDDRNLYILLIFRDPKYLSTISQTGITLFFNAAGKKSKDIGVRCLRKSLTAVQLITRLERQGTVLTAEQRQELLGKQQYVVYDAVAVTKKGEERYPAGPHEGVDPPGFKIASLEGAVVHEFRIPLAPRETHPAGIGVKPGDELFVGFEWGGLTKEMRAAQRGRLAPSAGTDMSQEAIGGKYGVDNTAAAVKPGAALPPKHTFWASVRLAPKE